MTKPPPPAPNPSAAPQPSPPQPSPISAMASPAATPASKKEAALLQRQENPPRVQQPPSRASPWRGRHPVATASCLSY